MEEQDHMLSGFGIKNRGFEGAVIFNANLFRQVERLMLEKKPFRAVIEYDPKRNVNTIVRITAGEARKEESGTGEESET